MLFTRFFFSFSLFLSVRSFVFPSFLSLTKSGGKILVMQRNKKREWQVCVDGAETFDRKGAEDADWVSQDIIAEYFVTKEERVGLDGKQGERGWEGEE